MYKIIVKTYFDAAHYIKDYDGKCSQLHGHRWEVQAELAVQNLNKLNMAVDFTLAKRELQSLVDEWFDHSCLNDSLGESNITAEYLAKFLWSCLLEGPIGHLLESVTVWESPNCGVCYFE